MSFYTKYELIDLVKDDGVKTFSARENATSRPISVHLFAGGQTPLNMALLEHLNRLTPDRKAEIIDFGNHEGTPYVVTGVWTHNQSFREWLADAPPPTAPEPRSEDRFTKAGSWRVPTTEFSRKSEPSPSPKPAGDFTRMFQTPDRPGVAVTPGSITQMMGSPAATPPVPEPQTPAPPAPDPEPHEPVPPSPPTGAQPGEFTRMFATPSAAQPAADLRQPELNPPQPAPGEFTRMFATAPATPVSSTPAAAPAPPPSAPAKQEMGEFTRMFAAAPATPVAAAPPSLPSSAPPKQEMGEFTRMFATPQPAAPAESREPAAAAPQRSAEPGEFTRMFASPPAAPQSAPSLPKPLAQAGPGEFTRFFESPVESAAPKPHPALADPFGRSNAPPPAPAHSGPGEFTRMFGTPNRPPDSVPAGGYAPPASGYAPPASPAQGASEYTRMFATPSPAAPAAVPSPSAAQPIASAQKAAPNYIPLIIVFGVLFILAVALVLYFALKK